MADTHDDPIAEIWPEDGFALDRLDPLPSLPYRYPEGWMSAIELRLLYSLARRHAGPVLEIGSWIGRSSSAIAAGLRDGGRNPAPIYDIVDFGPASAAEWEQRFGQKLNLEMGNGHVAAAVFHPGGPIAVLIDNLRRNGLLGHVTSIIRGDLLELALARRYRLIFCDAVHGPAEAARTMPKLAELVAEDAILVFDDVVTEDFADTICGYLSPVRRFLLASQTPGKVLLVHHRRAAGRLAARPAPPPAPARAEMETRRATATRIWRDVFAAQGIAQSVLLASTFRSGSTFVAELLARNGLPGLDRERFNKAWAHIAPDPGEAFAAFLREVLSEANGGRFATKVMWPHMAYLAAATGHGRRDAAELAALFAPAQWIHVRRRDKFDQAISFWRAKASGRWHVYAREPEPAIDYDFQGILAALREIELHDRLWDDFFARAGITPIRITYEEFEADPAGGIAGVLAALGMPCESPVTTVNLRRQRDDLSASFRDRFLEDLYRA